LLGRTPDYFKIEAEQIVLRPGSITVKELEAQLMGEKDTVRNAFQRYLRAIFNWGLKRDYCQVNPALKLEFAEVLRGETEIFEPETVQDILTDALENDLAFLPFRVLGFFCGIRPDGELLRVEWEDLHWQDKVFKLRAEITKKKRTRFVDVSQNALAWLEEYRHRGGTITGKIVPFTKHELRNRHRANWARVVGVSKGGGLTPKKWTS
jgi:integrase